MSKNKFVLTNDLIKVEPEPEPSIFIKEKNIKNLVDKLVDKKERISLNIDSNIKKNLHLYCVHNKKKMTDIIELSVKEYLKNNF